MSRRFGAEKLLAKWQGRELLGHVLIKLAGARAAGLMAGTIVVHRPEDEAIRILAIDYRCHPVATRVHDGELSWTLRTGIDALVGGGSPRENEAVLICLADQPLLRLDVIQALVESWSRSGVKAIRPSYRETPGEPGHPLLLDRSLWSLASEMRGETGFGPVLEAHRVRVQTVTVGGRNPDVDTPDDLKALEEERSAAEAGRAAGP